MSLGLSVVRSTDLRVPSTLCERPSPNLDSAHQCTGAARGRYHAAASSRGAEGTTCLNDIIDEPPDRISLDGAFDSLGERAAWGGGTWRPGFRFRAGGQLVATALFNLAFCLAVATWPMRTSGRAWFIMFILTESVAWGLALYFLWQKRESANGRFQAFVLQEGFVYSRMIEIYIWTWIGILYCLYVVGLTLATLPLHFDSATLPGSRGYMWVLNFYLSFPHLLAFDPVSSTKAFKEAAVRKGYPGAAYFHSGYLSRTALLAANASVFAGLWVFACGPVGLFAQSDYDFYALYAVTALNVVLMFQILPRYANMCKSVDALIRTESHRRKRPMMMWSTKGSQVKRRDLNQDSQELHRPPSSVNSRVGDVVLAAVSTRTAWEHDTEDVHRIGTASFRWGHKKGQGRGRERSTGDTSGRLLLPGEEQQNQHGLKRALRHTSNPLVTVLLGLWDLPRGVVMLALNVTASVKHIWHTWRWLAATRPEKFLLAAGFLSASLLLWPVLELRLAENLASMICNGVAIVLVLGVDLAMLSGRLSKADQEMILHAAEEGENVGSGLVFSTTSLLNALASGGSLAAGYVATEERLVDSAAISCRWDTAASWVLTVEQTAGRPLLYCTIMFSREQLHRAGLVAWRDGCRYMWIDTLSVPQPSPEDSPQLAARKEALLRRLVPTMTSVYATVRHVFIVETECGLELGPNCYSGRTWTLQECVINKRTAVVHLDGNLSILGAPSMRVAYTGLDATFNTSTLDDLGSYLWVLSGEERDAALSTTPMQRAAFQGFANTRSAARSADKAVALGQIFFRMLFEHADVATRFMHEVAVLLAEQDGPPLLLIDNTGWEPGSMSGSADPGRVLMGRPGPLESGDVALWTLRRVPPANSRFRPRRTTADSSALRHVTRDWNPSGSLRINDDVFANSEVDLKKQVRFASSPGQIDIDDDLAMRSDRFAVASSLNIPKSASVPSTLDTFASAATWQSIRGVGSTLSDTSHLYDRNSIKDRRLNSEALSSDSADSLQHFMSERKHPMSLSPSAVLTSTAGVAQDGTQPDATRYLNDGTSTRASTTVYTQSNQAEEWWLCKLSMRRTAVAVAIKPGSMDYNGRHPSGQLHQMRTCTEAEKARLESSELEKLTVTWW